MLTQARWAVGLSFCAMAVLGAGAVFAFWASEDVGLAAFRAGLFVVIVGCVQGAGYLLYVQQFGAEAFTPSRRPISLGPNNSVALAGEYVSAIKDGVIVQAVVGIPMALMLDGGESSRRFLVAFVAHWLIILLIVYRRPRTPTQVDLAFIRWGVLPLFVTVAVISPLVWSIIGESHLSGWERLMAEL